MRQKLNKIYNFTFSICEGVPVVVSMYFEFTCMPGESYGTIGNSGLCCGICVTSFWAPTPFVRWFCMSALGPVVFLYVYLLCDGSPLPWWEAVQNTWAVTVYFTVSQKSLCLQYFCSLGSTCFSRLFRLVCSSSLTLICSVQWGALLTCSERWQVQHFGFMHSFVFRCVNLPNSGNICCVRALVHCCRAIGCLCWIELCRSRLLSSVLGSFVLLLAYVEKDESIHLPMRLAVAWTVRGEGFRLGMVMTLMTLNFHGFGLPHLCQWPSPQVKGIRKANLNHWSLDVQTSTDKLWQCNA